MKRIITAVAIFLILAGGTALAASLNGQWNFTGFSEPDLKAGPVQKICFVTTVNNSDGSSSGTWISTTFIGWQGQWFQKGDKIRFYGTTGVLSTAEFGQFVSDTRISGKYAHFLPSVPVQTSSVGNFNMVRKSDCSATATSPEYAVEGEDNEGDPAIE